MFVPFYNTGLCFSGGLYTPCCCCCSPLSYIPSFNPIISSMVLYNPFTVTNLCSVPNFSNYNFQTSYNSQTPDISSFIPKMDLSKYTTTSSLTSTSTSTQNFSLDGFYNNLVSTISKNMFSNYQTQTTQLGLTTQSVVQTQTKDEATYSSTKQKETVQEQNASSSKSSLSASVKNKEWYEMTDAELRSIYGNYTRDITKKYTGGVDKLNKYLKGKGVLEGKGQAFLDAQEKYGISASVLVAICMNESDKGTSNLARTKNNVGGVRIPNSTEFDKFDSVAKCIDYMASFLKSGYVNNSTRSLTKLYEINARYCPVNDLTDKKKENSGWASAIERYASEIEKVDVLA